MALKQTNKQRSAIGDTVQRQQGAATSNTGGGAGNTNNAGNTGTQDARTVSPDVQASRNARVGEYVKQLNSTSPITAVKTAPSILSQGLETVNKLGVAAIPMEAARQVMTDPKVVAQTNSVLANARAKYGSESGGFLGIGSTKSPSLVPVVDAAELQRKALGTGQTVSSPSAFNLPDVDKEVSSAKLETPQSSLGNVFNESVKTYGSAESKSSSYYTPSGEQRQSLGGVQYTRDSSGNILRKDNSGNVSTLENRISSIGPNGTNADGSPLSAKDQAALNRSNQMVADWNAKKERDAYKALIANAGRGSLTGRTVNLGMIEAGRKGLEGLTKSDVDREQIASQEGVQARTLGMTARKNAFEEQRETARLGIDSLKAQSEVQGRLASQQNDTFKLIGEVDKNLGSTQDKIAVYKSRGMWNPLTIKATYPRKKLGSFKTPDELRQNLVNDESVDQGDIEDIVFSYFPSNQ